MVQVNAEEMYNWYVEDVINRNEMVLAFKEQCKKQCETMPLENVKKFVKEFYELERKEQGEPEKKTDDNDFATFEKNTRLNIIINDFAERPETLALKDNIIAAMKTGNEQTLQEMVNVLYSHFAKEINEKKLEEEVWRNKLTNKATEIAVRKIVGEDFKAPLNPQKDRGNCTKAITVSLVGAEEKFKMSLFSKEMDKEILAQPKEIAKEMEKYVKSSESQELKDIKDIKKGDLVLLFNKRNEPHHAMMVSGYNEQGEPLLLGFSPTQKSVPMFESKRNKEPRKGIVIDVHSLIKDKVNEHNRAEISKMMFTQKNDKCK
ncbi:MAG: hypothetical protein J6C85_06310 [Alphaproteobacteria bacterium]|nr:hypothetical protein [Alphaproteobacteria bacterium]